MPFGRRDQQGAGDLARITSGHIYSGIALAASERKTIMVYMECRHIKSNGYKCKSPTLNGKPYCYFHMRMHRDRQGQGAAPNSTPTGASNGSIDLPEIEDITDLQISVSQVLKALGSNTIDPRRGTSLLYGLQIATQVLAQDGNFVVPTYCIQDLTVNEEGTELGPEKYTCRGEEDCNKCPFAVPGKCDHWHYIDDEEDEEDDDDDDDDDDDNDDDD
jgi:hypothetical protein